MWLDSTLYSRNHKAPFNVRLGTLGNPLHSRSDTKPVLATITPRAYKRSASAGPSRATTLPSSERVTKVSKSTFADEHTEKVSYSQPASLLSKRAKAPRMG
ncbi:hypothetical protein AB1N83_009649 [Pleurotus pulmonarius]